MKSLHLIALLLVIVGGLNWGLDGLASWNLVAALFGADSALSRIVYVFVGLSAAWLTASLLLWRRECRTARGDA